MRKGGEGWRVKKGGERGSEEGRDGGSERGKQVRREGTRAKPGNQLVDYNSYNNISIHLLDPHWTIPRQAVISTQQHNCLINFE